MILCQLFILPAFISNVGGQSGNQFWKEEGSVTYSVNLKETYTDIPGAQNVDITGADYVIQFVTTYLGKMLFNASTSSNTLRDFYSISVSGEFFTVDPSTGMDSNGNWAGIFLDTGGLEIGDEVDAFPFEIEYTDDNGAHSSIRYYKIENETDFTLRLDGEERTIEALNIRLEDFSILYSVNGVNFKQYFSNYGLQVAKSSGVLLATTSHHQLRVLQTFEKVLIDRITSWTAKEARDLTLSGKPSSGLELVVVAVGLTVLAIISITKRRLKKGSEL